MATNNNRGRTGGAAEGGNKREQDDGLKTITPEGIVCFPHVWEPHSFEAGKEPNYSLILVFDEDVDLMDLKKICGRAAMRKFSGQFGEEGVKKMVKSGKIMMPWRDGAEYSSYGEPFEEGKTFITVKSKQAPGIVDERAKPILKQMDFYPGCIARASVYAHAFDTMGNKGVTLLLNNVQKTGDGERLSGRQRAEDEFEPVAKKGGGKDKGGFDDMDDDIPF